MPTNRVTSNGRITLPLEVRQRMSIRRGDEIEFREEGGRFVVLKKPRHSPFDAYVGYLKDKRRVEPDEVSRSYGEKGFQTLWRDGVIRACPNG